MVRFLTQDIFSVFFSPLLGLLLYVLYTVSIYDDGSHENGNPLTRILLSSFSSSSEPQNAAATALKRKEICFLSLADCESSTPMISSGAAMGERVISYALQFCPRSHPRSLFHANTKSPPIMVALFGLQMVLKLTCPVWMVTPFLPISYSWNTIKPPPPWSVVAVREEGLGMTCESRKTEDCLNVLNPRNSLLAKLLKLYILREVRAL